MATSTKEPQQNKEAAFGLPKAEFKPIAARGKQWFKITAAIVGIVLSIGIGVVYWFFYHTPTVSTSIKQHLTLEEYEIEELASKVGVTEASVSADHQAVKQETEDTDFFEKLKILAKKKATQDSSRSQTAQSHKGTITKIYTPQDAYYIVLSSLIDEDLASDYAHQLASGGVEVTIIAPPPGRYYYWVAIQQGNSLHNAYKKIKKLQATYGTDIWIIKY